MLTHPEEVILLRDFNHGSKAVRTLSFDEILLSPESLIGNTVPSLVVVLIDLSPIVEVLKDFLNHSLMPEFRGTDEVVVGDIQTLPERLEALDHLIAVDLWGYSPLLSGFFHFLAVFIRTGEGKDPVPH